ncbi:2-succinyl-5-enolpyruvyl-6-hydroxy-3-cyclohexene-1-carboxylic-acid synthase [Nocardioides dilutus]
MTSTDLARAVVTALLRDGVREIVLAPGSRNAPLSFAAYDAAEAGLVRLHTRIDERTAGFLALGLCKGGSPAAVVCTSGTAVTNLHPAMLEAAHARVRLVAVTADRPARLRGTDANQTTHQVGIFGRATADIDSVGSVPAFRLDDDEPVHWNVQLDDPLTPPDRWVPGPVEPLARTTGEVTHTTVPLGPRTVVVAGDDARQGARMLAEKAGWPLLAEPTSGSRTGTHAIRCYRLLLDGELGGRVERVVVAGHPTLSRPVQRLLARDDVEVLDMEVATRPYPVAGKVINPVVDGTDDPAWLAEWQAADASVSRQLDALLAAEPGLTPYAVAGAVSRALPAGGHLVVGASSAIRDLDLMASAYPVGSRRKVIANRGLSGIDGTVSTAVGASLARRPGNRNLALMGDVTFLHDSNGLVLGPDESRPDLTIVVVNDDGGSIFSMLEQGAPEHAHAFERLFGTPHGVDLASLCAATRTPHWRVDSLAELEHALANPNGGIEVVEALVRRDDRRSLDERIRALRP